MNRDKKFVKDGISLNFLGNDSLSVLVKGVVSEAITQLENIDKDLSDIKDTIHFLKINFDLPIEETKE